MLKQFNPFFNPTITISELVDSGALTSENNHISIQFNDNTIQNVPINQISHIPLVVESFSPGDSKSSGDVVLHVNISPDEFGRAVRKNVTNKNNKKTPLRVKVIDKNFGKLMQDTIKNMTEQLKRYKKKSSSK